LIEKIPESLLNSKVAANTIAFLLNRQLFRNKVFACLDSYFQRIANRDYSDSKKEYDRPAAVYSFRTIFARAFLNSLAVIYQDSDKACREALSKAFVHGFILQGIHARREKREPMPGFVTISPTNACNLNCTGCYAGEQRRKDTIEYDVLDWVTGQMNREFKARFIVISGGEPFMYKSQGKNLFDYLESNKQNYYLIYTNGTLIDKNAAEKLAETGNATPAISVEGFEAETDGRRGPGTYQKVLAAMRNLREAGVPFGVSFTATSKNAHLFIDGRLSDYFINEQKAKYVWVFQYMPIGRNPSVELLPTPEQRLGMLQKTNELIEKGIFTADFWNSGIASDGCMEAARKGGYFYILWTGEITPCVFDPFKDRDEKRNNVYALKENNLNLRDALNTPYFKAARKWQDSYWRLQPAEKCGNLLMPCKVRDHSQTCYDIIKETQAVPISENAGGSDNYLRLIEEGKMPAYNCDCRKLLDPVWEREFVGR
jgi:MoaA/NifB/PqqE/SkfB family radical SAM enzyme